MHYFALDGNYGDATRMIIVHTDDWTNDDWDRIMDSSDSERVRTAEAIMEEKSTTRVNGL